MWVLLFALFWNALSTAVELKLNIPSGMVFTSEATPTLEFELKNFGGLKEGEKLIFVSTPISGDPDMYISSGGYQWNSTHATGLEIITLNYGEPGVVQGATFTIRIVGFHGDSATSVLVYVEDSTYYVKLFDGLPQLSEVTIGKWVFFNYTVCTPGQITLGVSNMVGDSDVCITRDGQRPGPTYDNCWKDNRLPGSDVINFEHEDTTEITYHIGVKGFAFFSIFNVLINRVDDIAIMPESFPVQGLMEEYDEYRFYKYYLPKTIPLTTGVTFTSVRRSASGDADIFVSREHSPGGMFPTHLNHTWGSAQFGGDADICDITSTGFHSEYFGIGWYYIGIRSFLGYVRFDVHAARDLSHVILEKGKSFRDFIKPNKYEYFMFQYNEQVGPTPENPTIDIFVEPVQFHGIIHIYGSKTIPFPSESEYDEDIVTEHVGNVAVIHILNPERGWYYFSVISEDSASFDITASVNSKYSFIEVGETATASVEKNKYKRFYCDVGTDIKQNIQIALTTTNAGNSDLYVSTEGDPKQYDNDWYSESEDDTDVLIIDKDEPKLHEVGFDGVIRIGVYGRGEADRSYFTLLVSYDNTTIELKNGIPTPGSVERREAKWYKYYMSHDGRLTVNLQIVNDYADADLYVAYGYQPTRVKFDHRSMKPGTTMDYCSFEAEKGWWYVSIIGWSTNKAIYQVSAAVDSEFLSSHGKQFVDTVENGTWRYYTTTVTYDELEFFFVGITLISGNTIIYALNDSSKHPSPNNYVAMDNNWPENFIYYNLKGKQLEEFSSWSIGVYAEDTSTYLIHATAPVTYYDYYHYQAIIEPSVPIVGRAFVNEAPQFFWFKTRSLTHGNYRLYIRMLNHTVGSKLQIYVDQDHVRPTKHYSIADFVFEKTDIKYIERSAFDSNKYFYFSIQAIGKDTNFQISFSNSEDPIYLTQEYPLHFHTTPNEVLQFELFSALFSSGLNVVIDSCSERIAPKFWISKGGLMPNQTSFDAESKGVSFFSQQVHRSDMKDKHHPYLIATKVESFSQKFTIYAYTRDDFRPIVNKNATFVKTTDDTFTITVPLAKSDHFGSLKYRVFSRILQGDETFENINIYTGCAVSSSKKFWLVHESDRPSATSDDETFSFDITVPLNLQVTLTIIVETPHLHQTSYFPLLLESGEETALNIGYTKFSTISKGQIKSYSLKEMVGEVGKHLIFALTPFDGDADITIYENAHPTQKYKGESFGFDVIDIVLTEGTGLGPWTIEIKGATTCKFSILAYISEKNKYVNLIDGTPQLMESVKQDYSYYKFELDDDSDFTIGVTPIMGDPDVFVSTILKNPGYNNCNYSVCWFATSTQLDFVKISKDDSHYVERGTYYVGVYAWGDTKALFTLAAVKEDTLEQLASGIPYGRRVLANEYAYFKFELTKESDISIVVTPVSVFGDPDIYVSKTIQQPSRDWTQYDWKQSEAGADTLEIHNGGTGWYYIAVYGYLYDTDFQITVIGNSNSTLLVDGVIFEITDQKPNTYKFFRMFHGYSLNSLHFNAQPREGMIRMYASKTNPNPTKESKLHEWDSHFDGDIVFIDIEESEYVGFYYIGVLTLGIYSSSYTLTGITQQVATELTNGDLSIGHVVTHGFYKYFVFSWPNNIPIKGITVSLYGIVGDPDLYASCNIIRPTIEEHDWQSRSLSRDSIDIKRDELIQKGCNSQLHIAVHGYTTTVFSILAFIENSTMSIYEGIPVPGFIEEGYNQYKFKHWKNETIFVNLHMRDPYPKDGDLYGDTLPNPNAMRNTWASTKAYFDDMIVIENARDIMYYFAVHAYEGPFDYVLSISSKYTKVADGEQSIQYTMKDNKRCFKSTLRYNARYLTISVTPINGKTILYINSNSTLPSNKNFHYKVITQPNIFLIDDKAFPESNFPNEWSFCIYGLDNADFWFGVASDQSKALLESGEPRVSAVKSNEYTYFKFFQVDSSSSSNANYYILLNGITTKDSCFNIYADQTMTEPDPHSKWSTTTYDGDNVILKLDNLQKDINKIYVSVRGCNTKVNVLNPFLIMLINDQQKVYLLHDRIFRFEDNYVSQYAFKTSLFTERIYFQLDVCADIKVKLDSISISYDKKTYLPTFLNNNDFSIIVNSKAVKKDVDYSVKVMSDKGHNLNEFELFVSTYNKDPRPIISQQLPITFDLTTTENNKNFYNVNVKKLYAPNSYYEYHLYYYELDYTVEDLPIDVNYFTPCGIERNKKSVYRGKMTLLSGYMIGTLNVTMTKDTIVNVIVRKREDSLTSVFYPVLIPRSENPPPPPGPGVDVLSIIINISIGIVLIGIAVIILYFLIGIIVRAVCMNKKGWHVIPHFGGLISKCWGKFGKKKKYKQFQGLEDEIVLDDDQFDDPLGGPDEIEESLLDEKLDKKTRDELGTYGAL